MTERWETVEAVNAARAAMEARLGWEQPVARDWNTSASGSGYVTRFRVATPTARRYATQRAGGPDHVELWVPAEELEAFNAAIVGEIEVVQEYPA